MQLQGEKGRKRSVKAKGLGYRSFEAEGQDEGNLNHGEPCRPEGNCRYLRAFRPGSTNPSRNGFPSSREQPATESRHSAHVAVLRGATRSRTLALRALRSQSTADHAAKVRLRLDTRPCPGDDHHGPSILAKRLAADEGGAWMPIIYSGETFREEHGAAYWAAGQMSWAGTGLIFDVLIPVGREAVTSSAPVLRQRPGIRCRWGDATAVSYLCTRQIMGRVRSQNYAFVTNI